MPRIEPRVLVVEDDDSHRETLRRHLAGTGHSVVAVDSGEAALNQISSMNPHIVLTDVRMPGMDGFDLLERVRDHRPDIEVVMITGFAPVSAAIEAIKRRAFDFLTKPLDLDELDEVMRACVGDRMEREDKLPGRGKEAPSDELDTGDLIGTHPRMLRVYKQIGAVSRSRMPVLLTGETGTGKELVARTIHERSQAEEHDFVAVNCAALPDTLLESELFGHVKGAFTGAERDRRGRFELAGRGTLLLDEIGDTSPAFQSKLLRVLQERCFYPVGGDKPRTTEARIMAATHQPLRELAKRGEFRQDLFFRLRVVEIDLPPLRERRSDIPLLVEHVLRRVCDDLGRPVPAVPRDVMAALVSYRWPGNVRELENTLSRAVVFCRGSSLSLDSISFPSEGTTPEPVSDQDTLEDVEARHVQRILLEMDGNKSKTARVLGISRPRLDRMIERHDLMVG